MMNMNMNKHEELWKEFALENFAIGRQLRVHTVPDPVAPSPAPWNTVFTKVGQTFLIRDMHINTHLMELPMDMLMYMTIQNVVTLETHNIYISLYRSALAPSYEHPVQDIINFQRHVWCEDPPA